MPRLLIVGLLPKQPLLDPAVDAEVTAVVVDQVRRSLRGAPAHIRAGFYALGSLLAAWLFLFVVARRPWLERREAVERALLRFEALPRIGPNLMRVYRSLALLAYYDHPSVARAMGWEDADDRQARYRAERRQLVEMKP